MRDAKFAGFALRRPARPMFYVPLAQNVPYKDPLMKRIELQSHFIGGLMLVTNASPGTLEPLLTRLLAGADPNLTINSVRTMRHQVELTFDQERAVASLAGLFGFVALLLAAVGLYGVTAYTVAQRTNEIGIRMALGADRTKVVRYILRGALIRVGAGLALGVPLAIAAGRSDLEPVVRGLVLGPARAGGSRKCAGGLRRRRCHDSGQRGRIDFSHDCAPNGVGRIDKLRFRLTTRSGPRPSSCGNTTSHMSDMRKDRLELLQGTLDVMVLQTLAGIGPLHGYGIARRIEQVSGEQVLLNQGTIYASLVRLQQRGWISAEWGVSENRRKAKFYAITRQGRKQLAEDTAYWRRLSGLMGRMLAVPAEGGER